MSIINLKKDLRKFSNPEKAKLLSGFFKTGKGQYGEGDKFLGVMVPQTRAVAKKHKDATLKDVARLLESEWHEERLCGVLMLVERFSKADKPLQKELFNFYMSHSQKINNWDLVDLSAPRIVGAYLIDKDKKILYKYAKSKNLWQRRISIISTLYFVSKKEYSDALKISEMLLEDKHDLIHKAVGWTLREIGKRDLAVEEKFLVKHHKTMPRTMLRYAIERFEEKKRKFYMNKS